MPLDAQGQSRSQSAGALSLSHPLDPKADPQKSGSITQQNGDHQVDSGIQNSQKVQLGSGHEKQDESSSVKASLRDANRYLLDQWNDTAKPYPADKCIHQIIEERVAKAPEAIAVQDGLQRLTYAELNRRANQLANFLHTKNVAAEVPVAVCLKRSADLLVTLLAVLKAGGACVPLDPDYPSERLSHILEDCGAPILITEPQFLAIFGHTKAAIVSLSSIARLLDDEGTENLRTDVVPDSLAYLIYTSGSTGKPRGVQLTHRGLVNHGVASIELYGLTAADRMLQFASISFDIAIEEMIPTWFAGGCVVPRGEDVPLTAPDFLRWIGQHKITALDLPTAYWHELVHELAESEQPLPSSLRLVIVGGEKASSSAYGSWLRAGGAAVRWVNTYGPTEASVIASAYEPDPKKTFPDNLPIGRPIANTRLYVLDDALQPVPVGTPGELHIGGVGVARGYLNQPELTAARFIDDPFASEPGARLYKTGDMVRRLADGNLEFVGRIDFQVKIRGFRVELGEIESVLEKHPKVAQAVVIASENGSGKQLAGYVIPAAAKVTATELRDYVKQQLPEYMVPADVVFLESFPLTPNGKVDRRALPAPTAESDSRAGSIAPRNEFELRMAALWARVLGREVIGIRENFFELGGHSLLALRLTSRIEKEFGKKLTLTALIQAPTVEEMVRLVQADESAWSPLVPLRPQGTKPPLFFVHGLGGTVMRFHELARHMAHDQPFWCFQAQGIDGKLPVLDQVDNMAALYLDHLRKAQPNGPYYLGGYSFGGLVALEMARQLADSGQEIGLLALVDTYFVGQGESSSLLKRFFSLSSTQKLAYLKTRAKRYRRGIRRRIDSLSLPAPVKAVREACAIAEQAYRPSSFSLPLTLFRASDKALRGLDNSENGWQRYATERIEIVEIEGDHGNILNEPNVRQLAAALRTRLEQAQLQRRAEAQTSVSISQ